MKTNTLLLIGGIASAFYALILLAAPAFFAEIHGISTDEYGLLFIRSTGALCIGYVVLGSAGAKLQSEEGLKLAVRTNFAAWLTMFGVMLFAKCTLEFNFLIYVDLGFCALFSVLFGAKSLSK